MINVKISGTKKIVEALKGKEKKLQKNLLQAIIDTADRVTSRAMTLCPVDTSRLKNSITYNYTGSGQRVTKYFRGEEVTSLAEPKGSSKEIAAIVGTNVAYAKRIEFGFHGADKLGRNYNQSAQPYLRPAFDRNKGYLKKRLERATRDTLKK